MAIASNSPAEITHDYLQAAGIPDVFDTIVGAGNADHPKPALDAGTVPQPRHPGANGRVTACPGTRPT